MSEELIINLVVIVLGFLIGLIKEKPGYIKGKAAITRLSKAFEDDKITAEEAKALYELVKPKAE